MDTALSKEIEAQLLLSDDELFKELGRSVVKSSVATDLRRRGEEIYENLKSKLSGQICTDKTVVSLFKSEQGNDRVLLVAALIDCVSGYLSGIAPVTFCVLLVKEGLGLICKDFWKSTKEAH